MSCIGIPTGRPRAGKQPEHVEKNHRQRHQPMALPASRLPLIGMASMGFSNGLSSQRTADQRHGRVDNENASQYDPCGEDTGADCVPTMASTATK